MKKSPVRIAAALIAAAALTLAGCSTGGAQSADNEYQIGITQNRVPSLVGCRA